MKKRHVFQAQMSAEDLRKLRKIAEYKGVKMTPLLRTWIERNWARLPEEAK